MEVVVKVVLLGLVQQEWCFPREAPHHEVVVLPMNQRHFLFFFFFFAIDDCNALLWHELIKM